MERGGRGGNGGGNQHCQEADDDQWLRQTPV